MSGEKWMALASAALPVVIYIAIVVLLFVTNALLGVVLTTIAVPMSIGVYKEFISNWEKL